MSVPILLILMGSVLFSNIPEKWDISEINAIKFYLMVTVFLGFLITYLIICAKENRLPRAKSLAVLFVIDAETDQLYNDVKNKLVVNFEDCFWKDEGCKFSAICVSPSDLKRYDIRNKKDQIEILKKTNCALYVRVRYHVDDVTNIENYDMDINYGIVHPALEAKAKALLEYEMNALAVPIRKRRFQKDKALDTLDFTAQALSIICQYLFALICLYTGENDIAYKVFHELRNDVLKGTEAARRYNISVLINLRLFQSCMEQTKKDYDQFYKSKSTKALDELNSYLEEANSAVPNTYDYHLGKAYYFVAHDLDGEQARKSINECRKIQGSQSWKYSEAFLSAFFGNSATTIIRKYDAAFRVDQDLPRIADYIEYILEVSPTHRDLHLAVGLVYERIGDYILAGQHLREYLKTERGRKAESLIRKKMDKFTQDRNRADT